MLQGWLHALLRSRQSGCVRQTPDKERRRARLAPCPYFWAIGDSRALKGVYDKSPLLKTAQR